MSNRNAMGSPVEAGLVTRAAQGLRYVLTGQAPDWFGPAEPMVPQAPQTAGRMFDYMPGINLNTRPRQEAQGGIDFEQLRALADGYDLLRLVIETRKDQIARLDWCVRSRTGGGGDPRIAQATALFRFPDREHGWSAWLRMLVEDLLVIDAPTIYPRRTQGGDLYALDIIDGATIKRILDEQGRTPLPPEPAYQQVLKGIPTSDYARDELLYLPRNSRSHKVYGLSPVEQVVMTVNIALRRQMHQLAYYTEGNVPEALIGVPETWTPDQIGQFQAYWDMLLEGDLAQRRHARFVPATISKSFIQTKDAALKDDYDEWLARIICYAFSVSYQGLVKEVNRATAETAQTQAHQEGLAPLAQWVKGVMDRVLAQVLGWPDLEFAWATEVDIDPLTQAQVNQIYLTTGVLTAAEVRAGLGLGKALGKFTKDADWDESLHPRDDHGRFTIAGALATASAAVGAAADALAEGAGAVSARINEMVDRLEGRRIDAPMPEEGFSAPMPPPLLDSTYFTRETKELAISVGIDPALVRGSGPEGAAALAGVAAYRFLDDEGKIAVLQQIMALEDGNNKELAWRLHAAIADIDVNPSWVPASLTDAELNQAIMTVAASGKLIDFSQKYCPGQAKILAIIASSLAENAKLTLQNEKVRRSHNPRDRDTISIRPGPRPKLK